MSNQSPFSLRIFVADGDPDGLRLVERSNWIGKAVMFPRALYTEVRNRPEFQQTGVYLLLGPRSNGEGDMIYIGEGDPVRPRLENHYAKKDFWTRAVCRYRSAEQGPCTVADGALFRFTQDYPFNSPSLASSLVLGRSSNGRTDWKDASGRTLKQLQEAQAES